MGSFRLKENNIISKVINMGLFIIKHPSSFSEGGREGGIERRNSKRERGVAKERTRKGERK